MRDIDNKRFRIKEQDMSRGCRIRLKQVSSKRDNYEIPVIAQIRNRDLQVKDPGLHRVRLLKKRK